MISAFRAIQVKVPKVFSPFFSASKTFYLTTIQGNCCSKTKKSDSFCKQAHPALSYVQHHKCNDSHEKNEMLLNHFY